MDREAEHREQNEQSVRRGVAEALHAAFPVDPAASFNSEVAGLLALLSERDEADRR